MFFSDLALDPLGFLLDIFDAGLRASRLDALS